SEPVVQKQGNDRIIVELPGIDDPQRAQDVVQKSAFLEFQITDKSGALDKVLPRLDQIVREKGGASGAKGAAGDTSQQPGLSNLFTKKDSTKKAVGDSTKKDSSVVPGANVAGAFSKTLQQGQLPG